MILNPYLTFNGNCEDAFNFYKEVFNKEFSYFSRLKDMPDNNNIPKEMAEKVMHVSLPLSKETVLMGSDAYEEVTPEVSFGNNIVLSVTFDNIDETNKVFNSLADGGKIIMPLEKTFWAPLYGQVEDKFGINWMIMTYLPE